jgi:hypothetical protein
MTGIGVLLAAITLAQPATARADTLLQQVRVVDTIPSVPGYDRSCKEGHACVFGPAWNDPMDHSGCDTRNRVLAAQLSDVTLSGCVVETGTLTDPYSEDVIAYAHGGKAVQIDHVVPLKLAWDSGAYAWTPEQRQVFANDPLELLAVSTHENEAKGDASLSEWLPPNASFDCRYVALYLQVAVKYGLPITTVDRDTAAKC